MPNPPARGAGGRAGGASRGGPGGGATPGRLKIINLLYLLCLRASRCFFPCLLALSLLLPLTLASGCTWRENKNTRPCA
eukprot:12318714-Alexandrium_andersonii.AAC.1